jgi:hypothetical protein
MKMKSIIVILCFSLMHVLSAKEHGEELSGWRKLEQRGDLLRMRLEDSKVLNSTNLIYLKNGIDELNGWMREVITYSIPTNDVECYIAWLNSNTNLMRDFIYLCAEDESLGLIRALIGYLSDIKKLKGGGDARSYLEKHKALWCKQNGVSSNKGHREWRAVYVKDKRLRTALGRAETDIESMIEKLHRHLPKDRKEALLKIVIEITGETPEWYRKELEGKK